MFCLHTGQRIFANGVLAIHSIRCEFLFVGFIILLWSSSLCYDVSKCFRKTGYFEISQRG